MAAESQYPFFEGVYPPSRSLVLANATNGQAGREIMEAAMDDRIDVVTAMIKRDPRLLTTYVAEDKNKSSEPLTGQYGDLLTIAVARRNMALVERLLALGMPVDGVEGAKGEALGLALLAKKPDMAEYLLTRGASPDPQKLSGRSIYDKPPMIVMMHYKNIGGAMMLLRHGADVKWQDSFGDSYLQSAVSSESYRIAELLVQHGASPWIVGMGGAMPVQYLSRPIVIDNPEEDKARLRLLAKAEADARAKGLPWPPPDLKTVRRLVLAGNWPTPAMIKAGMPPVSEIALKDMRTRFASEVPQ